MQRRIDVVGQGKLKYLVVVLIVEPPWIACEAAGCHGIHETHTCAEMFGEGEMYPRIGSGGEEIPTSCGDFEITVNIFGGAHA